MSGYFRAHSLSMRLSFSYTTANGTLLSQILTEQLLAR